MRWRGWRQRTPTSLAPGSHDDLDVKGPHRPMSLNTWSLAGGAVTGDSGTIWKWGLAQKVGHMVKGGVGLAFYKLALLLSYRAVRHLKPHSPPHEPHLIFTSMQDSTLSATSQNKPLFLYTAPTR